MSGDDAAELEANKMMCETNLDFLQFFLLNWSTTDLIGVLFKNMADHHKSRAPRNRFPANGPTDGWTNQPTNRLIESHATKKEKERVKHKGED